MSTRSVTPMPSAPPEPPSPTTTEMVGVRSIAISRRLTAIASETWRSSEPTPGKAPGVSMNERTGSPNFSASLHDPQGLAVALGLRHAEVPRDPLLGVAPLLLGDDHDRLAVEEGGAADQRAVVVELPVPVQLLKPLQIMET